MRLTTLNQLKVPNVILDASDIPVSYTGLRGTSDVGWATPATQSNETRLVPQWLVIDPEIPHPSRAHLVGDNRPAEVIVELLYGVACCKAWGQPALLAKLHDYSRHHYYEEAQGIKENNYGEKGSGNPDREARQRARSQQMQGARSAAAPDVWDLIAGLWIRNNPLPPTLQPNRVDVEPKVEAWLSGVSQAESDCENLAGPSESPLDGAD